MPCLFHSSIVTYRYWRELHALDISRSEVRLPSRLGRQRHKAINQLRLTSWHLARLLAAVVRIQFDDVDVGH